MNTGSEAKGQGNYSWVDPCGADNAPPSPTTFNSGEAFQPLAPKQRLIVGLPASAALSNMDTAENPQFVKERSDERT